MTESQYEIGGVRLERGELFALGAAAGALVTAAISEILERRRRPATPWERAKAAGVDALDAVGESARAGSGRAKDYAQQASEYVQELIDAAPGSTKKSRRAMAKRRRKAGKQAARQAELIKEAAAGVLGAVAATELADKVRDLAGEAQSRGVTLKDQLLENYELLRESAADARLGTRTHQAGETTADTIRAAAHTAADTLREYSETARERLVEAELPDRARQYGATMADLIKEYVEVASERLRESQLPDRARDYGTTVLDAVETARERLAEAELPDRAKTAATAAGATIAAYGVQAADVTRRTARESTTKLGESATQLAQATSEQAAVVRQGVQTGVRRTRRRTRWGLRALLVGVAVGILVAPQSGGKTREALGSFVQNFLDVLMPDEQA